MKLRVLYFLSALLLSLSVTVKAQNTFAFKAKVIHNKTGMMKQFSLLVNSNVAVTNDAGILVVPLTNNTTHIRIGLQQMNYSIIYPVAGYVAIPRDLNDMPEIIIGNRTDNTYLNQYLNLYKAIKNNKGATSSEVNALDVKLDSLQKMLLQLNFTESDLRNAKDMQDGKEKSYPEISENLQEFVSRAVDLKAAFQYVASFAFDKSVASQKLRDAVTDYTNIYNTLNRQRRNYQEQIDEYWRDDSLSSQYTSLINYALDSLHANKLFPLQADIALINEYYKGAKNKELKEKIEQHIKELDINVQPMLDELKKRNNLFQKNLTL